MFYSRNLIFYWKNAPKSENGRKNENYSSKKKKRPCKSFVSQPRREARWKSDWRVQMSSYSAVKVVWILQSDRTPANCLIHAGVSVGDPGWCWGFVLFLGVSEDSNLPLEPEGDVEKAPSPPTEPPGSPEPAESAKPRTSKKKSKVEAWSLCRGFMLRTETKLPHQRLRDPVFSPLLLLTNNHGPVCFHTIYLLYTL